MLCGLLLVWWLYLFFREIFLLKNFFLTTKKIYGPIRHQTLKHSNHFLAKRQKTPITSKRIRQKTNEKNPAFRLGFSRSLFALRQNRLQFRGELRIALCVLQHFFGSHLPCNRTAPRFANPIGPRQFRLAWNAINTCARLPMNARRIASDQRCRDNFIAYVRFQKGNVRGNRVAVFRYLRLHRECSLCEFHDCVTFHV